ncbi:MAG: ATP-binding protein [Candidatus Omnitrophota bacterium]|nr:ATP-binding protein [Candidatus Omnitrophota bacterium]
MIKRTISEKILHYARRYPVVTLTGPRQSGKTTLCKALFPKKKYFSLENIDIRDYARTDPRSFLNECLEDGAVIDEIQRVPELVSYIQEIVDTKDRPGLFVLTGSQNFHLLDTVSQSLAGRTALAVLLPFSYNEIYTNKIVSIDKLLFTGFYPRIHDKRLNPAEALSFYVSTYLERDIRALINVKDLAKFEKFLKLCAGRTAQIINLSNLANDCGVNHNTVKSWLGVLEASYVIFFVRPHHANFGKRLIKAPKLYFTDCGLAAHLLDIQNAKHIVHHPLKGALFENFAVAELLKARTNQGKNSNIYFFRDNIGNEVDILLENGATLRPVEIKLGMTISDDYFKGLRYYQKINQKNAVKPALIYGGNEDQRRGVFDIFSYRNAEKINLT